MQQLRKVLTQTTWANASDAINKNSDRIYEAITRVENATTKNKGYFETSNALLDTYPNPSVGDIAFVFNSANTVDTPYDVYKAAFSSTTNMYEWCDSGINASFADVDINSVNDSIKDIEQQVDTLKDPRLPIICDANGRIGLNVGNGLYVDSNGDLCATQSIGGGGGSGSGGESYYAAAGISINEDNFISVKVGASLEFDNDNALKVGTGEGLVHNSNGKLSVNVGKGLVIDDKTNAVELEDYDAIKEIPIAIQKKQDKLIEGSGIEITSENIINVDGSNLQVLLSTNAINDEDGNRIRATYAKKEEVGGIYEAIEATNTTVASHTQSIESLELNKQDKLDFGNGLETVGNLVKVEDAVLKDIADNKADINALGTTVETLSSSISGKQDKLTASDGINLDDGKLSVHIGTGLDFDPESSAVVVKVGAGIKTDINQSLAIKHDATLTTDADGQLGVNQGTITNIAASEVAKVVANAPANYDTLKEIADYIATDAEGAAQLSNRIGALESALPNKMDTIAFGSGLAFSSNVVKVADAVMTDIANNKSNIGKLQSLVDGLSTSKQDTISDLATIRNNAANGATAYGWGYHGTAGYAKKAKVNGSTYESDSNGVINLPAYPTTLPASDVYAWAKASSKPSYSWSEINNKPDVATKEDLNNKQDTLTFGSGLTNTNGVVTVDYKTASVKWSNISDKPTFATVATSGSYNDLSNKPTIPSAVTESTVSGWGFTKNTGTYSKPSGGIPKSDLASSVQTSLSNADDAYGWGSHKTAGYAKSVRVNNQKYESDASGQVILPDYPTSLPANGGNADTVDGYNANNIDVAFTNDRGSIVDLEDLDPNYYYPCSTPLTAYAPTYIKIWVTLGDFKPVPSWATHDGGFVLNLEWKAVGEGWGTILANRVVYSAIWNWADGNPCGGIAQNSYTSEEIVWLRGGSRYFCRTTQNQTLTVHPNGYSWSMGDYKYTANIRSLSDRESPYASCYYSKLGVGELVTTNNVGIGVTDPQCKLDVNGDARLMASGDNPLYLHSSKKDSEGACRIHFEDSNNAFQGYVMSGWGNLFLTHRSNNQIGVGDNGIWCSKDNGNTKLPILHEGNYSSYTPVHKKLFFKNDYECYVVLLCKVGNNTTNKRHRLTGKIYTELNGGTRYQAADIDIFVADWVNGGDSFVKFNPYGIGIQWSLETCMYEGHKWLVLRHINDQAVYAYFVGTHYGIDFTPIKYYHTSANHVYNEEIYNSFESVTAQRYAWASELNNKQNKIPSGYGFENVGGTLKISTSYITEKIKGDGLILDESGRMSVDSANLSVKNADTLDGHDSSYFATKNELGNKQNTLAFGSGIAHSNNTIWVDGSQLNVNYANSAGSVAWGNVSGRPSFGNGFDSTNNVVQLKLSTGLAIDDRGYLYVTGL